MKKRSMKLSLRLLLVLMSITMLAQGVLAAVTDADGNYDDWGKYMGAGIALGLLYFFRGFGIVAWAHSIYDLIILTRISTQ